MAEPNFTNRTLWTGDNLDVMRGFNSETVDLIYLDPPFNSNQDYAAPVGSAAAGAAFKDTWSLSDLDVAWMGLVADEHPAVYKVLDATGVTHGKGMQAYLCMMAVRLLEMRRLLKPKGSIYLHCDPTASHYLKMLMDAVFGAGNFRNEVVWKRTAGRSDAKRFGRVHDVILFYSKGNSRTWNTQYQPHAEDYVRRAYRSLDDVGRWRSDQLTASGLRHGESGEPWRGIDPGNVGRHWNTPTQGGMNDFIIERELIPGWPDAYPTVHARLDALDIAGLIHWPKRGTMPSLKRYLESTKGTAVEDVFTDIGKLEASAKEKVGYPTQKPLALLDRIIAASSNEGDVVLDPFCGCATACIAAEILNRQWIGIDLSPMAYELVRRRLSKEVGIGSAEQSHFTGWKVTHRTDIPRRTDIDAPIPYHRNRHVLFGRQEGRCNGCRTEFPFRIFEVDHRIPRSKGGSDEIGNLQLLCSSCNRIKGDRPQEYLVARLKEMA